MYKTSFRYKVFKVIVTILLILFGIICLYPLLNTLAIAFNEGSDTAMGGLTFYPRKFTTENLTFVLGSAEIQKSFIVTLLRVVIATVLVIVVQFAAAYAFTQKDLPFRKAIIVFFMVPMFISGGLIANYVVFGKLHILNTFWVYILPSLVSFYNIIVIRTNIQSIPSSLFESAKIDGASELTVLFRIVLPLSKAIIATIALWTAVAHWNDWTTTMYYASRNKDLYTLQYYIQMFVQRSEIIMEMIKRGELTVGVTMIPQSLQAAQIVVTIVPIMCLYPFLQKYFIKGVMIGSVKE